MRSVFAIVALAASAFALTVTAPDNSTTWTTDAQSPHVVSWSSVSTDPSNFTIVLSNEAHFPPIQQILDAQVVSSLGSTSVNAPSGGWPTGTGFQINLVKDNQNLNTILAQSNDFTIKADTGSSSSTIVTVTSGSGSSTLTVPSSPSTGLSTSTPATTTVLPDSSTGTATNTDLNPPAASSNTSTSPNNNGALAMGVQAGFFGIVALVGAMLV